MKSTIYIKSLLLICGLYLAGCENKLDEDAELRSYQNDIDYSSEEGAYGAIVGAYETFQDVGWEQIPLIAVRGDDVNAGGLGDQQGFSDTDNYTYDNNYWMYQFTLGKLVSGHYSNNFSDRAIGTL